MSKSLPNHQAKAETGFWSLSLANNIQSLLLIFFIVLLPTQFGKHFWPDFSLVDGLRIDYLSPTIYLTDLLIILLLVNATAFWKQLGRLCQILWQKQTLLVLGGLVLVISFFATQYLTADRPILILYGGIKLIELCLLALYLSYVIKTKVQLTQLSFLFAISAVTQSFIAILQYLNQGSLNGWLYFLGERYFTGGTPGIANVSLGGELVLRPYATFPHPNVLAGYLLISIILIWFYLIRGNDHVLQRLGVVALLICSITLLLTFSRIAIFLFVVGIMCLFAKLLLRKQPLYQRVRALGISSILLLLLVSVPLTQDLGTRFIETSLQEEAVVERLSLLEHAWTMIRSHPLIGVGLHHFIPSLAPMQQPFSVGVFLQPVHNIFVLTAAESGIIGIVFVAGLLVATLRRIKQQTQDVRLPLMLLIMVVVIIGCFDHYWLTLQQGQLLLAVILGLSWAKYKAAS